MKWEEDVVAALGEMVHTTTSEMEVLETSEIVAWDKQAIEETVAAMKIVIAAINEIEME